MVCQGFWTVWLCDLGHMCCLLFPCLCWGLVSQRGVGTDPVVEDFDVLSDFMVDRIYPVEAMSGTAELAYCDNDLLVGTSNENAYYFGFRPRDDQSGSLGYEVRTWFEILNALGAYPGTGSFEGVNDNTEYLSRTTDYLCCRFPNGALAIAPHLRDLEEGWPGGFARKAEEDAKLLENITLPSDRIALQDFRIQGRTVSYTGAHALTFRLNDNNTLIAFAGRDTDRITVDGVTTVFADHPMPLVAWAPVRVDRLVEGGASHILFYWGEGELRIPVPGVQAPVSVVVQSAKPGSRGEALASRLEDECVVVTAEGRFANRWIYVVPGS